MNIEVETTQKMKVITINGIDDLCWFIQHGTWNQDQLNTVLTETIGLYLIREDINRDKLILEVRNYYKKYAFSLEKPLFLMDA